MPYLHAAVTTCIIWKAVVINYSYADSAKALHTISKQRELIGGSPSILLCKFVYIDNARVAIEILRRALCW